MKRIKPLCLIAILAAGLLTGEAALAEHRHHGHHGHHGHIDFGLSIGIPYSYPYPYYAYPYYPYPYYPPVVAVPATPPVYIEQDRQQSAQEGNYYWYYCDKPKGYYPYVKQCPGGWQEVEPEPARP